MLCAQFTDKALNFQELVWGHASAGICFWEYRLKIKHTCVDFGPPYGISRLADSTNKIPPTEFKYRCHGRDIDQEVEAHVHQN